MLKFLRDRKVGKAKKDYFKELTIIAKEEREKILRERTKEIISEELKNSGIYKRIDDISKYNKSIEKKLDDLKSSLVPLSRSKSDSIRKIKMKRMIIELLNKDKRLTASDMSAKLNLSRTRCSEYLTEMERDGVAKGVVISRQKFYELTNQ
jgi:biotin operon repressor